MAFSPATRGDISWAALGRVHDQSESRYRHVFDSAAIGMVIHGPDFTPLRANRAMLRTTGLTETDFLARDPSFVLGEEGAAMQPMVDALVAGDIETFTAETRHRRPDGEAAWALTAVSAVLDGFGRPSSFLTQSVDVTHRKRAEQQLADLVRSKDELITSVSHELRTPLTSIVGLASELRDRYQDFSENERVELMGLVSSQAAEMADLIDDLLVASRRGADGIDLNVGTVDVATEIRDVLAGWSQPVLAYLPEGTLEVSADPARFRQIMRNLLANARKYGHPPVEVVVERRGDVAAVAVRDRGPGLPEEQWEPIFDRYYRAHQLAGQPASVGLGLSLSRELARMMGGDLVYRVVNGTSHFQLLLPTVTAGLPVLEGAAP